MAVATALLVIDVPESFRRRESWAEISAPETTARPASDLGYRVRFVLDATATHPPDRHDGGGRLSAAQVQERTAAVLQDRFAEVVTMADVLAPAAV